MTDKGAKTWIIAILAFITCIFACLSFRLVKLHTGRTLEIKGRVVTKTVCEEAVRGTIFDRTGKPLAMNVSKEVVNINPVELRHSTSNVIETASAIAGILKMPVDEVFITINRETQNVFYSRLKSSCTKEEADAIQELNIDGIAVEQVIEDNSIRYIPYVNPQKFIDDQPVADIARKVGPILDLNPKTVYGRLNNKTSTIKFTQLKSDCSQQQAENLSIYIRKHKLKGITFSSREIRFYPNEQMSCHVLGFLNSKGNPYTGIESEYNKYLKPSDGYTKKTYNALGNIELRSRRETILVPTNGCNVYLTIDLYIQYIVENSLDELMEEIEPKAASVIVQDVNTGEILAIASRPAFNPNQNVTFTPETGINYAVFTEYEPGSIFKAITIAAALNENIVTENTQFDCENGLWYKFGKPLHDSHPYGILTVREGIKKSSNILAAKVALELGDQNFYNYIKQFGLGRKTNIDLPNEQIGILNDLSIWSKLSPTRLAMGHEICVTPIQMVGVFSAIANGGRLMRPYIVKEITTYDGETQGVFIPKIVSRPITEKTSATMRSILAEVPTEEGTARRAAVKGYKVAGKTGTAQKIVDGLYSNTKFVASFAGFIPVDKPQVAIIVVVDEPPRPKHYGGTSAAPTFSKIAESVAKYLEIPSETVNIK
ncbi:MAG: penicillin-binding protein 2 [Kiritimatiellae bacterium]|jgi:cell division protein FtsI/penicillin-binding protein 2|nr:penicillin-binding protein 2 [Kiritimatiellia bacterium]